MKNCVALENKKMITVLLNKNIESVTLNEWTLTILTIESSESSTLWLNHHQSKDVLLPENIDHLLRGVKEGSSISDALSLFGNQHTEDGGDHSKQPVGKSQMLLLQAEVPNGKPQ